MTQAVSPSNQAQADYWNGRAGLKWSAMQVRLDRMLTHVTTDLVGVMGDLSGRRVLDVGCGTGETCARWLSAGAQVTGVDLSGPMLAVAADRSGGRVTCVQADASAWRGDAPFDVVVSRLGVMFFADPDAAFANLAANLRPGGRLVFVCWRAIEDNAWVQIPLGAIADLVPHATPPVPNAPGPFGLADAARLTNILTRAGLREVRLTPLDVPICLAETGGATEAADLLTQIGPSGAALVEASDALRAEAAARLTTALGPHADHGRVELGGALWRVEAVRPA